MKKLKLVTVIGTRPEIIKLSQIIKLFDTNLNHIVVHTGQNYDYELNEIFFKELSVRKPDYFLSINTSSLGKSIADIISKTEEVLIKEKPDALLPTMGGQTALNLSIELESKKILKKFNVRMIGASQKVISKAEDRELFKKAMKKIGIET